MKQIIYISIFISTIFSCNSQTEKNPTQLVGGPCEDCKAIFEYGNKKLTSTATLPNYQESEFKLKVTGTIYQKDGKTPAENVILYLYHTNRKGIYETIGNEKGWAKRHGIYRGWIKTDTDGKYTFHTFRPAAYPNGREAEHIHLYLKEPNKNEYYIDNIVFLDDKQLTSKVKKQLKNRGGSGVVEVKNENGILTVQRDIILGKNIPDY